MRREKYFAREEVLSVVTLGCIGSYGDVRWRFCCAGESGGMPPEPSSLASPLWASLFHVTNFYHDALLKFLHTQLSRAPQKCFQSGPALAKVLRWRTQWIEMMCNARLFTSVVKPEFTEHRRRAVSVYYVGPTWFHEFNMLKDVFIFSWSSVTLIVISRLSHITNSIFQFNCMFISIINQQIRAVWHVSWFIWLKADSCLITSNLICYVSGSQQVGHDPLVGHRWFLGGPRHHFTFWYVQIHWEVVWSTSGEPEISLPTQCR